MNKLFVPFAAMMFVACSSGGFVRETDEVEQDLRGPKYHVYTATNEASGNRVLAFDATADGTLIARGSFSTGGVGTSAGLGNQGGLVLSSDRRFLLVVNAGSNDVSSFKVRGDGSLALVDRNPSGGTLPISVTVHDSVVYVLNAGGTGNIRGLRLDDEGRLSSIAGSTRSLSGAAVGPAQVGFSPDGEWLTVTEKATSKIDVWRVGVTGLTGARRTSPSSGTTPFGFAFTGDGALLVSEAFGGAANASALSSYRIESDGDLDVLSASVPTGQTAACWVAILPSNRFAYTTNTGSGSVSGYALHEGLLTLSSTTQIGAGSSPLDMAVARNGKFVWVLEGGSHMIGAFAVAHDGSLSARDTIAVPATANGLAGW
ncbi:MAG: beta-propeller fold lactonase family protein [Deltaproteobacteria bacterium]|nr:beta-propeller fold lactonase family protein [Deltaproteobacteria bacterium]